MSEAPSLPGDRLDTHTFKLAAGEGRAGRHREALLEIAFRAPSELRPASA